MFDGLLPYVSQGIGRCWRTQQLPAEEECGTPVGVRQEAEMADLDEAGRQDVKQEPADELDRVERQELLLIPVGRVSPAEGHVAIVHIEQAAIGDGHPAYSEPST